MGNRVEGPTCEILHSYKHAEALERPKWTTIPLHTEYFATWPLHSLANVGTRKRRLLSVKEVPNGAS